MVASFYIQFSLQLRMQQNKTKNHGGCALEFMG